MKLRAEKLVKIYKGRRVVDGVSLQMDTGEIVGLLGPNGAGKTTTLSVLTGLRKATSGSIRVLGLDPARQGAELRRAIGVLPEQFGFYDWMSAEDYLRWFANLFGLPLTPGEAASHLDQVGLDPSNRQPVGRYSRGMRQRLGLARALLNKPRLLILDEPTNGLDPRGRREIHDVLLDLAQSRGVGILLCTHLLDDVDRLCSRIGILHHGRTLLEGGLAELLATRQAASRYRLRLASQPGDRRLPPGVRLLAREGEWWHVDVAAGRPPSAVWVGLYAQGWNILEIHAEGGGLEELYLTVTEEKEAA